jgi:hypothetical protein
MVNRDAGQHATDADRPPRSALSRRPGPRREPAFRNDP